MPHKNIASLTNNLSATDPLKRDPPIPKTIKVLYHCRCRNTVELYIQAEAVLCVKCGTRMKPQA